METISFKGFGGVRLDAELCGDADDPAVLLIHGAGQTRAVWREVSEALVQGGRRVVSLDLRGHGTSDWPGRYDLEAHVQDLRAVLAQMGSRPVVVATTLGGWIATLALASDGANLAAALVLVDMPVETDPAVAGDIAARLRQRLAEGAPGWDERALDDTGVAQIADTLVAAAPGLSLPTMVLRGGFSWAQHNAATDRFEQALPNAEVADVAAADLLVVPNRTEAFVGHLLDFLERRQPRGPNEFRSGSDPRTLRDAMGCFATGITIITALTPDGAPVGLTANSFTSVSLDPPLLLVCIANTSGSAETLRGADQFAVNVLQTSQQQTSNRFAGKGEDRFAATAWEPGEGGVPLLKGSLVAFECRRHEIHESGDHFILVGEVTRAQFEPRRDPLLYFRGKYRRLHLA